MAVEAHFQNPGEVALLGELKLWWEAESRLDSLGARYSDGDDVWLSDAGEFRNRITRAQRIFGADLDSDVRGALVRAGCVTRDELAWADSLVKRPDPDDRDGQDVAGGSDEEAAAAIPEEPHAAEPRAAEPAAEEPVPEEPVPEEPVATPSAAETEAPDDAAPVEPAVDDESGADHDDGEADGPPPTDEQPAPVAAAASAFRSRTEPARPQSEPARQAAASTGASSFQAHVKEGTAPLPVTAAAGQAATKPEPAAQPEPVEGPESEAAPTGASAFRSRMASSSPAGPQTAAANPLPTRDETEPPLVGLPDFAAERAAKTDVVGPDLPDRTAIPGAAPTTPVQSGEVSDEAPIGWRPLPRPAVLPAESGAVSRLGPSAARQAQVPASGIPGSDPEVYKAKNYSQGSAGMPNLGAAPRVGESGADKIPGFGGTAVSDIPAAGDDTAVSDIAADASGAALGDGLEDLRDISGDGEPWSGGGSPGPRRIPGSGAMADAGPAGDEALRQRLRQAEARLEAAERRERSRGDNDRGWWMIVGGLVVMIASLLLLLFVL